MMHVRCLFGLFLSGLVVGCSSIGYYAQSIHGHLALMGQSKPIEELITDPAMEARLRQRLKKVQTLRAFAVGQLGLPDNGSYKSYADIGRDAVVWSVVATPELSLEAEVWCYPVIGCASYRGYFDRAKAEVMAADLQKQGFDVAVQPVPAYSTLGWFADPLPSTVIHWKEPNLAGLIFHELAHQKLYVKDDSAFNEAFASSVEQAGVELWMSTHGEPETLKVWKQERQRDKQFVALLMRTKQQLVTVFRGDGSDEMKRQEKGRLFLQMKLEYGELRQRWAGYSGYDRWFDKAINNAHLASVATYEQWVPAFSVLLERSGGLSSGFYKACDQLAKLPLEERAKALLLLQ